MERSGAIISKFDKAVFMCNGNEKLVGLLVNRVDDFLFTGTDTWEENILEKIKESFSNSFQQIYSFKYLGLT